MSSKGERQSGELCVRSWCSRGCEAQGAPSPGGQSQLQRLWVTAALVFCVAMSRMSVGIFPGYNSSAASTSCLRNSENYLAPFKNYLIGTETEFAGSVVLFIIMSCKVNCGWNILKCVI